MLKDNFIKSIELMLVTEITLLIKKKEEEWEPLFASLDWHREDFFNSAYKSLAKVEGIMKTIIKERNNEKEPLIDAATGLHSLLKKLQNQLND